MIIVWIQKHMINQGIYFDDNVYNDCALAALGKEYLVQAKKSLPRFTDCLSMAKEASKNFRSKASKRTKAEVVCQFTGDGRLFSNSGDHNKEVGLALLEGYRQITLATWPAPKSDVLRDMTSPNDHNTIRHLTAHQIAYVGVKENYTILARGAEQDAVTAQYQETVADLEEPCFNSKYVKLRTGLN
ncbi:hypothetical protein ABBQ32_007070 [Trebouxia sp. C0010 RCD-2024]